MIEVRAENCDPHLANPDAKNREKCPYCGQFHLRAGYCQAMDPLNAAKFPGALASAVADGAYRGNETPEPQALPAPLLAVTDKRNVTDNSRNADTDSEQRACIECDALFVPARSDARYCSTACRMRAARKRMT